MRICQQCQKPYPGMFRCPEHGSLLIEVEGDAPALLEKTPPTNSIPELSSYDGTGTMLLGIKPQPDKTCYATAWKVWNNLPIKPLSRHRLRVVSASHSGQFLGTTTISRDSFQLQFVESTPLVSGEIFWTVVWHWLIAPLVLLAPFVVSFLLCGLTIPPPTSPEGKYLGIGLIVGLASIGWGRILWIDWRNGRLKKLAKLR